MTGLPGLFVYGHLLVLIESIIPLFGVAPEPGLRDNRIDERISPIAMKPLALVSPPSAQSIELFPVGFVLPHVAWIRK